MEGNYWGDVRQEHTNKVERQSVQDGVVSKVLISMIIKTVE